MRLAVFQELLNHARMPALPDHKAGRSGSVCPIGQEW
jgi:hypothetical protein